MIALVVALDCEAKPLLKHFRLKIDHHAQGFRVYRNERIALIISSMGRVASAAATAYLRAYLALQQPRIWLNIGIGGQRDYAIGDCIIAHKISESNSRQCWYPPLIFEPPCATATVNTVDQPEADYPGAAVYEMEASGFYPTACRFNTAELIHVIKVISDNRAHSLQNLTAAKIEQLIADNLVTITDIIGQIEALSEQPGIKTSEPVYYQEILARWHFTTTQRHQLQDKLQRWQVLCPDVTLPLAEFGNSSELLTWLQQSLATLPTRVVLNNRSELS